MHKLNKSNMKKSSLIATIAFILAFSYFLKIEVDKRYYSKFTSSKWIENENKRILMVDDMLKTNELEEKNKESILKLLGEPTKSENIENRIIYYLGDERSLISIDSEWLVVYFDEKEKCTKHEIITD